MSELRLDWASYAAAKYACEAWHYTGRVPPGTSVRVGVWERERYIGVVVFSRGPSGHLGSAFGLNITQVCELSRIALDGHETPVTQIVSQALRMLRSHCPGLRLVISFADPARGHLGRIYQAGNWIYLGRTAPSRRYIDPEGTSPSRPQCQPKWVQVHLRSHHARAAPRGLRSDRAAGQVPVRDAAR